MHSEILTYVFANKDCDTVEENNGETKQRWNTEEMRRDFEVIGFLAPFVFVIRNSDGAKGSMEFTHDPRWYFNFVQDKQEAMNTEEVRHRIT